MIRLASYGIAAIGLIASVFGIIQGIAWLTADPQSEDQRMVEKLDRLFQKRLEERLGELRPSGNDRSASDESLREDLRGAVKTLEAASKRGRDAVRRLTEEGKTDEARALLAQLAEADLAVEKGARKRAALRYGQLGALAFLDDTEAAIKAYEKAAELNPNDPRGWNGLGTLQLRTGALDAAIQSFERVLRIGNAAGREDLVADALGNLGSIYGIRGEFDRAEHLHKIALKTNLSLGHEEAASAHFGNLGGIYYLRGQIDDAERMHLEALQIGKKFKDKKSMAADYGNLGLVYLKRGMLDRAEGMFLKGLELDEEIGREEGVANKTSNLGLIYFARGNFERAEELLLKALQLAEKIGSKAIQAQAFGNLGLIHAKRGESRRAETLFRQDLMLSEELGSKQGQARAAGNLGTLHEASGDTRMGCKYRSHARNIFREIGMLHDLERIKAFMRTAGCPQV